MAPHLTPTEMDLLRKWSGAQGFTPIQIHKKLKQRRDRALEYSLRTSPTGRSAIPKAVPTTPTVKHTLIPEMCTFIVGTLGTALGTVDFAVGTLGTIEIIKFL